VAEDENPKKFNEEKLRKLRPAFGEKGTITAGNASSINDGAAALVVASPEKAKELGLNRRQKSWVTQPFPASRNGLRWPPLVPLQSC